MKNLRTLASLCIAFSGTLFAQTSTSDCDGSIQLCGGVYTELSAPQGSGNVFEFTGICNQNAESASLWYTFTVQEAGDLSFVLDPANDADDYDWGLFNITDGGCAGINAQNGSSPEVECNLMVYWHERPHRDLHRQWRYGEHERPRRPERAGLQCRPPRNGRADLCLGGDELVRQPGRVQHRFHAKHGGDL
ncbi:MAG: hypothetical protein IPI95_04720 [Flavobacteriales bacterium]|nr:hypothetical protein [Flavobacteriales bacterium]